MIIKCHYLALEKLYKDAVCVVKAYHPSMDQTPAGTHYSLFPAGRGSPSSPCIELRETFHFIISIKSKVSITHLNQVIIRYYYINRKIS